MLLPANNPVKETIRQMANEVGLSRIADELRSLLLPSL